MKTCEQFQALIVDLQDVAPDVRADFERHAETCRGCRARLDEHQGVMAALRDFGAPLHVEGERLTRFAIYRAAPTEPDYDQSRLSGEEIQQIEGHVSECPRCRLTVDSIVEHYREMDRFLGEAGVPAIPIINRPPLWVLVRDLIASTSARAKNALIQHPSYPTAAVALGVLLLALWTGPWLRGPYHRLAFVETTEVSFLTRDSSSELARGVFLMNDGQHAEAITLLEPIAHGESDDYLRDYARYLSGLSWLHEARTELFGRILSYHESCLDHAIEHLRSVTESARSGRIVEESYWLLGKAYLMKRDPVSAVAALREVEQIQGRRAIEARQLLEAIELVEGH